MTRIPALATLALLFAAGCTDVADDDGHSHSHDHDHGAITTLVVHFTPVGGGDTLTFTWADPDLTANPEIDPITLPDASDHDHHDAQSYTLDVEVWNELEDPTEDVTPEILELADQHQVFFTGSAVEGPATGSNSGAIIEHVYDDTDADGLPLGLSNRVNTLDWGNGDLTVTLRHMPYEDGSPIKVEGLADTVANDGFDAIGGDNDIQVTFPIVVE